jgi:tripartite ATP-independent transporter DctM subunit
MIPPSIVLIFYGLTANVSIGELFVAVIMPGLLLAGLYLVYILVICGLRPEIAPPLPFEERNIPLADKLRMLKGLILPMGIAFGVLGSIYTGVAAVTEAAAVGVAGTIFAAWVRGALSWGLLRDACQQTMSTCGLLLWLTFGATALIGVYNLLGGIRFIHDAMTDLPFAPIVVVLLMMAVLIVLGLFMDWVGILLLTMPIFVPIIQSLGYDPIWFGILFCMNMQISYLSPPFGPAAFYLKSVAPPEISLHDIYKALWPFMLVQIAAMLLVMFFPQIALWLPAALRGGG